VPIFGRLGEWECGQHAKKMHFFFDAIFFFLGPGVSQDAFHFCEFFILFWGTVICVFVFLVFLEIFLKSSKFVFGGDKIKSFTAFFFLTFILSMS